jgi:hypothetical protein
MPQANSTTSSPRVTSPRASANTLPCSRVIARASSSVCCSISALKRNSTRARDSGVSAAQAGCAAAALSTARRTSSAEARRSCALATPVAGLNTGLVRVPVPGLSRPSMKCPMTAGPTTAGPMTA